LRAEIAVTDSGVSLSFSSNFCAVTTTSSSTDTLVEVCAVAAAARPQPNRPAAADTPRRRSNSVEIVMAGSPLSSSVGETTGKPNPDKFF
jgi:hypothetical protein